MMSDVLAKYMDNSLNEYYICYFDILGYRAYFDNDTPEHKKFLATVLLALESIKSVLRNFNTSININCKTCSDNFLLYFEKSLLDESRALETLINIMRKIQVKLLMDEGLLLRGGRTLGEFYADENLVFGKGLVRAVELEEKYAIAPRIIIDDEYFKSAVDALTYSGKLIRDFDGYCFVNYFDVGALKLIKGQCIRLINIHCKYHINVKDLAKIAQRERIISKYMWLLARFNSQCIRMELSEMAIKYDVKINERLYKPEIIAMSSSKK